MTAVGGNVQSVGQVAAAVRILVIVVLHMLHFKFKAKQRLKERKPNGDKSPPKEGDTNRGKEAHFFSKDKAHKEGRKGPEGQIGILSSEVHLAVDPRAMAQLVRTLSGMKT